MYMMFFWLLRSLLQPYFVFFFNPFSSARLLLYSCRQTTQPQPNTGSIVSKILAAKKPVIDPVRQCNLGRNCFSQLGDVLNNIYETLSWSCSICIFISTPWSNPFLVPITINSDFSHSRSTCLTKLRGEILQIFIYKYLQI